MKSVMLSIQPKWCEKICHEIGKEEAGNPIYEKRIEVRKTAPKEVPFKAYIYETKGATEMPWVDEDGHFIYKGRGQVIGEFVCDKVYSIKNQGSRFSVADEEQSVTNEIARQSCLDYDDMVGYLGNKDGCGLHITALKIYDKPKELFDFANYNKYQVCKERNCFSDNCWICDNNALVIRPPQSWCYVEEL